MATNTRPADTRNDGTVEGDQTSSAIPASFFPPGFVFPYYLPQEDVEEPFEPISSFAISESGKYGPLDEQRLKTFLRRRLDRRTGSTADVIQKYTTDVNRLNFQLRSLQTRIHQISSLEKERTDFIKKRISDIRKTLLGNTGALIPFQCPMRLSMVAKEAFQHIGSKGPLLEDELLSLMKTGVPYRQVPPHEIVQQLKELRLRINDNVDIENYRVDFWLKRISKALEDMNTEMMTIPHNMNNQ